KTGVALKISTPTWVIHQTVCPLIASTTTATTNRENGVGHSNRCKTPIAVISQKRKLSVLRLADTVTRPTASACLRFRCSHGRRQFSKMGARFTSVRRGAEFEKIRAPGLGVVPHRRGVVPEGRCSPAPTNPVGSQGDHRQRARRGRSSQCRQAAGRQVFRG